MAIPCPTTRLHIALGEFNKRVQDVGLNATYAYCALTVKKNHKTIKSIPLGRADAADKLNGWIEDIDFVEIVDKSDRLK